MTKKRNKNKKPKIERFKSRNFQSGNVVENLPLASWGTAIGATLEKRRQGQLVIVFEKAVCSCGGENENCYRCDGTGFYVKKVMQDTSKLPPVSPNSRLRTRNQAPAESTFSNDARGGEYGIREQGRYGSSPLHDDHE